MVNGAPGTAYERLLTALDQSGRKIRHDRPSHVMASCPGPNHTHGDRDPSLSVTGIEGQVLLHCQASCSTDDVLAQLGFDKRDLFDDRQGATYTYDDGRKVVRTWDKKFRQNNTGDQPILYRLRKIKEAVASGRTIWLVEGEKDVHAIEALGEVATTAPQGASNFHLVDITPLFGADIIAIPDRDEAGAKWARQVESRLQGKARSVAFVLAKTGKDAADHIAAGYALDELLPAVPPESDESEPETEPSSWKPKDLTRVLDGTWKPPQPTVGRRTDGRGLFYPTKTHSIIGETEAGKGWVTLSATIDEIQAGNHVVYVDFEDNEEGVVGRLLTLGMVPKEILSKFHYIRPEHPLEGKHREELLAALHAFQPTLAVLDGVTEAMTMHGHDPNNNVDIALFNAHVVKPMTMTGAAAVSLDHVVKQSDNRGKYALGGVHKLNIVDGASYILENRQPFAIGLTGISTIKIAKDRPGQLRINALSGMSGLHWYGDLVLASKQAEFAELAVEPPHKQEENFRPTKLMKQIADELGKAVQPLPQRELLKLVPGRDETKRKAFALLVAGGYVSNKTPHTLVKSFEEEA